MGRRIPRARGRDRRPRNGYAFFFSGIGRTEPFSGFSARAAAATAASSRTGRPRPWRRRFSTSLADVLVVLQELPRVLAALAHALAVEGVPGARLLDDLVVDAEVEEVALLADALAVEDVELGLAEGRRHLVLDHLHLRAAADDRLALLERRDAADVEAHRRVELEGAAAGGGLGVAEHHADLLAQLVDEDEAGLALRDDGGELAQRLAHEAGLQAHLRVAHLALELGAGDEGGHRVDDQHVDRAGADEDLGDLERLLAAVGLRDEEVVDVDAQLAGVDGVERVLGVHEGGHAAAALRLGDDVEGEGGLARGLRAEDLDDAAAGQAAHAERGVEGERSRGDGGDVDLLAAPEPHDRALAELLVDLREGGLDRLGPLLLVVSHRRLLHPFGRAAGESRRVERC